MLATLENAGINNVNFLRALYVKMLENDAKYFRLLKPPKLAGKL